MTTDRRKHRRLPLTLSIATPLRIELHSDQFDGMMPGILVNISAGGMALIVFHNLPQDSTVEFDLDFMGIRQKLSGKIVREEKKFEETYMVGIEFDEVSKKLGEAVESIAEDHEICQVRYLMNPETACFPECSFSVMCGQRIKKDFTEVNR